MASERMPIACLGAGRMGRGIAVQLAYAGHDVVLLDLKPRAPEDFARLAAAAATEVRDTLTMLAELGLGDAQHVDAIAARVRVVPTQDAGVLADIPVVFEGVPEILDLKRDALAQAAAHMAPDAILASTTSTIVSTTLPTSTTTIVSTTMSSTTSTIVSTTVPTSTTTIVSSTMPATTTTKLPASFFF